MIGRALRGKKAGAGKDKEIANIVFFTDNWKRVINFATPEKEGDKADNEIRIRGHYPIQYIAIKLVEDLSKKIDSGIVFADRDFLEQLPVGWYETEVTINVDEETNTFREFVIVYQNMLHKFEKFIKEIPDKLFSEWENENLTDEWMQPQVTDWIISYFDNEQDNRNKTLDLDLIRIARHIAQAGTPPVFCTFEERDQHDLSKIAFEVVQKRLDDLTIDEILIKEFNCPDKMWQLFYYDINRFSSAFDAERRRAIYRIKYNSEPVFNIPDPEIREIKKELTEKEKEQVFIRDNYTCLCCGKFKMKGKRVNLEIDHIIPLKFGGQTTIDNSQTLCSVCNKVKSINEVNFRVYKTSLSSPKEELELFSLSNSEYWKWVLQRIVNSFYHCQAVSEIKMDHRPRSKYRYNWEISLYEGNNPAWLKKHKKKIVDFVHKELGYELLKNLTIK